MDRIFSAHAKLMISGEYLVLKGVSALAVPLRFKQSMYLRPAADKYLHWGASDWGGRWFQSSFTWPDGSCVNPSAGTVEKNLEKAFRWIKEVRPEFFSAAPMAVDTHLDFHRGWGWGSSAGFVVNLARWAEVDPYALNRAVFGGSGYDIACASATGPILYHLLRDEPHIEPVAFNPPFADQLYFVYLGRKQNSHQSIRAFSHSYRTDLALEAEVSAISKQLISCFDLRDFDDLIQRHEALLSQALGLTKIAQQRFKDFPGAVKSLGAWGGDFVLMTWREGPAQLKRYLHSKGLEVFFSFQDLVLQSENVQIEPNER